MTRREALGLVLVAMLVLLGRGLRHWLLVDANGAWREPGWLESHLPAPDPPAELTAAPPRRLSTLIDPNSCPIDSLVLLPGIGPAIAGRIVEARGQGVHFACARDMQVIRGIGPRLTARIEPHLTFGQRDTVPDGAMRIAR